MDRKAKRTSKKKDDIAPVTPQAVQAEPLPAKPKEVKQLLNKSVQLYLAKMPLAKGQKIIPRGKRTDLAWLSKSGIKKLIKMGAVRPVLSPPLSELAGWKTRAKRLLPVGVVTLADFLAVEAADLARFLRVKKTTVDSWQDQLRVWSEGESPPKR